MAKKRRKKSDKTKLKEKLWALMRTWLRLYHKNTCCKCGKLITTPQDSHPSHILSRGAYPNLAYDPRNVLLKCMRCHNWWHKNPLESKDWYAEKYPDTYKYLMTRKNYVQKINEPYIEVMIEFYQQDIKRLEDNIDSEIEVN